MGRILIVDDEESIRITLKSFLSDEGHDVVTAGDYGEALALTAETDFDLIFADIILGDKTGLDLLREIKARNLGALVVIITGYPNIETASESVRLGAFDYIPKPVRQDAIFHVTELALRHKALRDEKEKYRLNLEVIFKSVKDAIVMVDKELRVVEFNESATALCGFSRDVVGQVFSGCGCNGQCVDLLTETITKKQSLQIDRLECQPQDGPRCVLTLTSSPLLDPQGGVFGALLVVRDETRLADLERNLAERQQFHNIIGKSEGMQKIYSLIEDLSDVQTTVLVTGESGTGKELVAEALHYAGERGGKPLVKVNCSALPENLLESELFGHARGAFTGAIKDKIGRFQRAHGGTIFLDEIGDISPSVQLRLLRVLEKTEFERVGDSTPIKVDVRVVAATHQNLREKIKQGKFREDLYYRLKVVEITLPPLRKRREDIPLLVDHFIEMFNKKLNKKVVGMSADVQRVFMEYPWPGNVRELEHVLEHAFIVCAQDTIITDHLPMELRDFMQTTPSHSPEERVDESQAIREALEKTAWNKARAARMLGISRRTIYRKMKEYAIEDREA